MVYIPKIHYQYYRNYFHIYGSHLFILQVTLDRSYIIIFIVVDGKI